MKYRIFVGAPSASELKAISPDTGNYSWSTFEFQRDANLSDASVSSVWDSMVDLPLPAATLEAATQRISLLYRNVIFGEADDLDAQPHSDVEMEDVNETTAITWPPSLSRNHETHLSIAEASMSRFETQETSYAYSDGSSIVHFPKFHFSINTLVPLSHLKNLSARQPYPRSQNSNRIPALLLAILEVTGPDIIQLRKGPEAGKEIHVLKMILGNKEGICKVTAWRDTAQFWGEGDERVKRGDVVFLEKISFSKSSEDSGALTLTASPLYGSKLQVCYRCLPDTDRDIRFRPDLRLASGEPCVRAVKGVVEWFEGMAGLKK